MTEEIIETAVSEAPPVFTWFAVLVVTTALDMVTTAAIIFQGGYEGNPFMAPYSGDPVAFTLIKVTFIVVIMGMAFLAERYRKGWGWAPVLVGAAITSMGVINNFIQLMLYC